MTEFTPCRFDIDHEILSLMENISRKQGELSSLARTLHEEMDIESVASIDAVHFSTKLEGNTLSRDQVTEALHSKKVKAPARQLHEILNYSRVRRMLREWTQKNKPFNENWVLTHHSELLKGIVKGKLRGHFREAQCVIKDSSTKSIVYMAPEWGDVASLMEKLLSWLRREKLQGKSGLLLAAQFHFEFVTIHPFMDGNGRLARLLTNNILLSTGYNVERYAALEKQHELNRLAYYRSLRQLQVGNYYNIPPGQNIHSWVVYWLQCLLATYNEALERVGKQDTKNLEHNDDSNLSFSDRFKKAELVFRRHQKLRAAEYADLLGLQRTQAVADLNRLVEAGLIERIGGGRSTMYRMRKK